MRIAQSAKPYPPANDLIQLGYRLGPDKHPEVANFITKVSRQAGGAFPKCNETAKPASGLAVPHVAFVSVLLRRLVDQRH
jgi:hypothetical protein